jgi:hypothetical protein
VSCEHDCPRPPIFPKPIANRPGLTRIDYRIGTYADLRAHILDTIDKSPALRKWTHRGTDDPGIALVEAASIVGDVLTFYQSLYANEAYLRTAKWRECIVDLARLLGYRLAPGLGGEALFAIGLKSTAKPVTVPKGFGLKAQLAGADAPAEFESTKALTAYPHLSRFSLFKPFAAVPPALAANATEFVLARADGGKPDVKLAAGTRLMVGTPQPSAANPRRLPTPEVLVVDSTREELGQLLVRFKGGLKSNAGAASAIAFVLGDSYRHFGHNAPPVYFKRSGNDMIPYDTWYERGDYGDPVSYFSSMSLTIPRLDWALDREVKTLAPGTPIVMQAEIRWSADGAKTKAYTLVSEIEATTDKTLTYGAVSGPSTVITLKEPLVTLLSDTHQWDWMQTDLRTVVFHEVRGEALTLRSKDTYVAGGSGATLSFYGTGPEATALQDRKLALVSSDGACKLVPVTGFATGALDLPGASRERGVLLDSTVDYSGFLHPEAQVTAYGNLVGATQGKTIAETPLGSGDARATFQTFAVPKTPLTYLLDASQTPPQTPELQVYVDEMLWSKVDTFFGAAAHAHVYVVREDAEGKSYVQFGDGKSGARLPSGRNNVTAVFRTGSGAYGALKADTQPQATGKLTGLEKVYLPQPVTTGAAAESEDNARETAPARVQSLGRLVSLADFEAETLALPNVLKATAAWAAPDGVPLVQLTVLTQSESDADVTAVRDALNTSNRSRGPGRFPVHVTRGLKQYLHVTVTAGFDSRLREQDVREAIQRALGMSGSEGAGSDGGRGLFGLHARRFGENAHTSQIVGAAQQVEGVVWVTLQSAQPLWLGNPPITDPLLLWVPYYDWIPSATIACGDTFILALHAKHLTVNLAAAPAPAEVS